MRAPLGTRAPRRVRGAHLLAVACSAALLTSALAAAPAAPGATGAAGAPAAGRSGAAATNGFVVADSSVFGDSDTSQERCESEGFTPIVSEPLTGNGTRVRSRTSETRTLTAPDDPADTTTFAVRSTASGSVRQSGGAVRSFAADATAAVSAESALGAASDCDYQGIARGAVFFDGPLAPGFLRLALDLRGTGGGASALVSGPGLADAAFLTSTNGEVTFDIRVGGGEHRIDLNLDASVGRPDADSSLTRSTAALSVRGRTTGPGGAWGRATGSGRSQVWLPAARSCPSGTVTATLTRQARNARRVVLLVDGKRRATVTRPRPGREVVVRRARAGAGVTVTATITRTSGTVLTTAREYAPCSG